MIDALHEHIIPLTEACRLVPARRQGRPCNVATVYRWTLAGVRGIRLESIQIGGTRCTSREAMGRFFAALTAATRSDQPACTPSDRLRQIERAEAECQAAGIGG